MTNAELGLLAQNKFASTLIDGVSREMKVFAALVAAGVQGFTGTQYDSLVIAGDPTASRFLRRGEGYTSGRRTFAKGKVNASRIGFMIDEPVSVTDEWNRAAAAAGIQGADWLTQAAQGQFASHIAYLEQQFFTGTTNDTLGFLGLKEICSYTSANVLAYASEERPEAATVPYAKSVINAGGSAANTAGNIYLVRLGADGVKLRIGGENGIAGFLQMSPVTRQYQADSGDATRQQEYYKAHCEGYVGLDVMGSSESYTDRTIPNFVVRRIANVTADSGKGCTEALLDYALESFPDGKEPNIIFMDKRSQRQLRTSKASSATQFLAGPWAQASNGVATLSLPLPEAHRGIPIIATRRITSTQAIES